VNRIIQIFLALLAVAVIGVAIAGSAHADGTRSDVIRPSDIQASIDQRVNGEAAQRQAIRELLQRPDVRKIAGAAGLDLGRASAAVGQLSGAELAEASARADEINGTTGGRQTVTIEVTTIIIILLLLILLTR
jgi:hypothetical protein